MPGLDPSLLRKAKAAKDVASDTKDALRPKQPGDTKAAVKDAAKDVAAGAIRGAATGGWVGAAKGAAVSFIKSPAGRKLIVGLVAVALVINIAVPLAAFIFLNSGIPTTAGGDNYRSGESVKESGLELSDADNARRLTQSAGVPWEIYLALEKTKPDTDVDVTKLADSFDQKGTVVTLGAAGVYVGGKGKVLGTSESEKRVAQEEETYFVEALERYGLTEPEAKTTYKTALAWRLGEMTQCTASENSNEKDKETSVSPAPTASSASLVAAVDSGGRDEEEETAGVTIEVGTDHWNLSALQVSNIKAIAAAAKSIQGVTSDALTVAFMAAMAESTFFNYANSSVPDSLNYPHDKVGSNYDSVGFWQFRAGGSWGPIDKLMTIPYQVQIFFGGAQKPETSTMPGLLDIDGWEKMTKAEAAQAFEVSAEPGRYAQFEPLAVELVRRYSDATTSCDGGKTIAGEAGHPLGDSNIPINSGFGGRESPGGIGSTDHKGIDFQVGCDHPIYSVADGEVIGAGFNGGWGNMVEIDHGNGFITRYAHMPADAVQPAVGSKVKIGDQIGRVGTTGNSTGCHLHFETLIDGVQHDPYVVLTGMGVKLIWLSEM